MKLIKLCLLATLLPTYLFSSSNNDSLKIEPAIGLDLSTRYIWRGMMLDNAAQFQPWADLTYKHFSIGAWGSYATDGSFAEVDLYLSYAVKNFTFTLNDYFTENEDNLAEFDYFNWKDSKTNHALEALIAYQFSDKIPLKLTAGTFLYGYDLDEKGNNLYSTWLSASYTIDIDDSFVRFFVGGTPYESMYHNEAAITSVGAEITKKLEFTNKFSIPLNVNFTVNPTTEDVFLTALLSF
ncbi:MAG TPA: hypothetical protein VJ937_01055 [Salinivirga sp.]|uniref:hypothetical protein n=1 Tax=Salinivirga sp. TaxID=1970192 RepID=UPI002B493326|nr:hypothetical protein [Salinivirga sp.]HKK58039.1 hypothetical protein [Salinivirga sp.]